MITNKQKIAKLELLLSRAILSLHPDSFIHSDKDNWIAIDKIIEIDRYIKELQKQELEQTLPITSH